MFWTNVAIEVLLVFFVIDCALLCLVVLMQRSKQEGLGAAFGGGFTESVWGAQTSQVLVKATVVFTIAFFVLSISLAKLYAHREALSEKGSQLQEELLKPVVPAASTNAAPATSGTAPGATHATPATNAAAAESTKTPATNAAPATPAKAAK